MSFRYFILFLTGLFLLVSCENPEPFQAKVTIYSCEQQINEEEFGDVIINFKIENEGSLDIDRYAILFEVVVDTISFREWTIGLDVPVGSFLTDSTEVNIFGKKYEDGGVKVIDIVLNEHY